VKLKATLAAIVLCSTPLPLAAQVWISEFMAVGSTLKDEDGSTPDWLEIWNTAPDPVNLGGWHLTDRATKLTKWTFPATNLASGGFLVVFASGKDRAVAGAPLHTNFKLSSAGEYLGLVEPDGQTISHQYSPAYPPQVSGVSYGIQWNAQAGTWEDVYFIQPTPGATNSMGYLGLVAAPEFSVPSGFVELPFTVAITTATDGAQILFTTNGAAPTAATGVRYDGPIPIARNTVLRALATKPGYLSPALATRTYICLANVLSQNQQTATAAGFPAQGAAYAMNPAISGPSGPAMSTALQSLPSLSLSTSMSNLFDPLSGIYANAENHGPEWERQAAIEWLDTNGQSAFQIDCGIRIQGGVGRSEPKKSFRLLFKKEYAGTLKQDLFQEPGAATEFHSLILRAGFNDAWFWLSGSSGKATYIRDEFGRRLLLAMGHPSARGLFVNLYINGLYWGLYNVTERPNADFSCSYLGGQPNDWDAIKAGDPKHGDMQAWNTFMNQVQLPADATNYQKLQGCNFDGARNAQYPVYFDKFDYIDYIILNYWGGNWDWPAKNYWLGWNRTSAGTGFKCYPWDIEGIVDDAQAPLNAVVPQQYPDNSGVGVPHHFLKTFSEYKLEFADRVQEFFFNGGPLTPQALANRFGRLADEVEGAILLESALWGNGNLSIQSQAAWRKERDYILTTWLRQRTAIVLGQFVTEGLYPRVGAPALAPLAGATPAGYNLVLTQTNSSGAIYFTLDGSDPRLYGLNTPAPTAQVYTGPLTLHVSATVLARVLQGTQWSALLQVGVAPGSIPYFSGISAGPGAVILQFPAAAGQSYSVLWNPLPLSTGWSTLLDIPAALTNEVVTVTNSVGGQSSRFFRLVSPAAQR